MTKAFQTAFRWNNSLSAYQYTMQHELLRPTLSKAGDHFQRLHTKTRSQNDPQAQLT